MTDDILLPCEADEMRRRYPVSTKLNNLKNEAADCAALNGFRPAEAELEFGW